MTKIGFRSITIPESVYERFSRDYQESKNDLAVRGIRSLSGYISYMFESRMQENETLARRAPMIKRVSTDSDRAVLLDNTTNRIAEIVFQNGELFCQLCEESDCLHTGFAYALPEVNAALGARGIETV